MPWRGEEFIVLFPDADATVRVTVIPGLAEVLTGEAVGHALGRADRALYEGKRRGRERVVVADDAEAPSSSRHSAAQPSPPSARSLAMLRR